MAAKARSWSIREWEKARGVELLVEREDGLCDEEDEEEGMGMPIGIAMGEEGLKVEELEGEAPAPNERGCDCEEEEPRRAAGEVPAILIPLLKGDGSSTELPPPLPFEERWPGLRAPRMRLRELEV